MRENADLRQFIGFRDCCLQLVYVLFPVQLRQMTMYLHQTPLSVQSHRNVACVVEKFLLYAERNHTLEDFPQFPLFFLFTHSDCPLRFLPLS